MSHTADQLLLYGVFRALVEAGMPLGTRDYLDGIQALNRLRGLNPFDYLRGMQPGRTAVAHADAQREAGGQHLHPRAELIWFCQLLWARSDEERRLVDNAIARGLPLPPASATKAFRDICLETDHKQPIESVEDPAPTTPDDAPFLQTYNEDEHAGTAEDARQADEDLGTGAGETVAGGADAQDSRREKTIGIAFELPDEKGDMTLPALNISLKETRETFLLDPRPVISIRKLINTWRRYYLPSCSLATRELDAAATIRQMSATGKILRPVFRRHRANRAHLVVLIDVGEGMAPWQEFSAEFAQSLAPSFSRLSECHIFYFNGAPSPRVYRQRGLFQGQSLEDALEQYRGRPLLVLSDADAARGLYSQTRVKRLDHFFQCAQRLETGPIAWINPTRENRWPGTSAERILLYQNHNPQRVRLLPLDARSLLHAVDWMRGARQ